MLEKIINSLEDESYYIPSKNWIEAKVDNLRKKSMIIRQRDGSYALTNLALGIVPHGLSNKSSDIDRILELGKRKW